MSLLEVRNFTVGYHTGEHVVEAVRNVDLSVVEGEILGLVGESGSGKSTLVKGMLRILGPPGVICGGDVVLDGHRLLELEEEPLRALRWKTASIVPQSALNSFNPLLTVGEHISDTLVAHQVSDEPRAQRLLELVDLDPVHIDSYPHQMSGGMRQRAALALALALEPKLVVMDEPTTALDVVVERQILRRVLELQRQRGFAILFITHDVALLMEFATRIGVMYSGSLVEIGPVQGFRDGGTHPYTQGLLRALPPAITEEDREPIAIPGAAPHLSAPPSGCRFHPRCSEATAQCRAEAPALGTGAHHRFACWQR